MDNRTIDEIRKNETVLINELKRKEDIINKAKEYIKKNGHPRGYLGHKHNENTRKIISLTVKNYWGNMTKEKLEERNKKQRITNDVFNFR